MLNFSLLVLASLAFLFHNFTFLPFPQGLSSDTPQDLWGVQTFLRQGVQRFAAAKLAYLYCGITRSAGTG
jgi:hypothetical protein